MKIAVVQKCPSNINFESSLQLEGLEVFNLSSKKVSRLLKRDIDLVDFSPEEYDWVILVGSEAVKQYTKVSSVSDYTGKIAPGKNGEENFIACISPAMLAFKPENKPVFDATVEAIHKLIKGETKTSLDLDIKPITELKELEDHLNMVLTMTKGPVALDSETSALEARKGYMLGLSMSYKVHQGIYASAECLDGPVIDLLQQLIETREVVFHNAKFDMKFFEYHLGLDFKKAKCVHDTMIQHYLLDERQGTHGLKSLTMKYGSLGDYDRELEEFKAAYCKSHGIKKSDFTYDLIPFDIMWKYASLDTAATLELHEKFYPIICNNDKLKSCYHNLMLPSLMFLTRVEERGIPISKDRLEAAKVHLTNELDEVYDKLYAYDEVKALEQEQGAKFNPNSTAQLRKLFFDHLNLPIPDKLTATGNISTDAEVLKDLAEIHEVPGLVLKIRKDTKLINTYIDKLLGVVDADQRVRTGFNLTSTTSGRLSSSGNFNFQQLPSRDYLIKGCIKAPKGYKIVAFDLSAAEVWVAAALSNDKAMQEVFRKMITHPDEYPDFHSSMAAEVFGLDCDPIEVKSKYPEFRQASKAITFSLLYGSGPQNVADTINKELVDNGKKPTCTLEMAKGYFRDYYNRFPQLERWISNCHNQIKSKGFIYNPFGRKRRLANITSKDRGVAAGELRSGFNSIIQSTSSDILLLGAVDIDNEIISKGLDQDMQVIGLVHDSIVAVIKEDKYEEYCEIVKRNIQKDRGVSIFNAPIGLDEDTEPGGSVDYSGGKMAKQYPSMEDL